MITPKGIKKKAIQQYAYFLRAMLQEETFFPLLIKGKKGSSKTPLANLFVSLKILIDGSKEKIGYGYQVKFKTVNTRHSGPMSMPESIFFDTDDDYLKFIGKAKEVSTFQQKWKLTRQQLPQLENWIVQHPLKLIKHLNEWEDLLKVAQYFLKNPQPNQYTRALPINVHTKFIEQHQGILKDLLDFLLEANFIDQEENRFEKRYGLLYDEASIRLRLLAPNLLDGFPEYVKDITLPLSQFEQLGIKADTIFVVENKQTFLAFPDRPKSALIWGKGFSIELLKNIAWLKDKQILFWGDLDVQGFQMLHQLRTYFPQTKSLLMGKETYLAFAKFAVTSSASKVQNLSNLNAAEHECFLFLKNQEQHNRLEQENITHHYLLDVLKML